MKLTLALEQFLPHGARFAVRDPQQSYPLIGTEKDAVLSAIEKRKNEFSAGRDAARDALAQLGFDGVEIPVGNRRAPIWPKGICGSITHSKTVCIAAAARQSDVKSIGIDAEPDAPLKVDLRSAILHESELNVSGAEAIVLFSMKEALFKAQFPVTGQMMGFHDAKSDAKRGLTLTRQVGNFSKGTHFDVPVLRCEGHVISLCTLHGERR